MLATARRAPENLRLEGVQLQTVRGHPVADRRNALRHTALKFVCSSWLTEPVYLGKGHKTLRGSPGHLYKEGRGWVQGPTPVELQFTYSLL